MMADEQPDPIHSALTRSAPELLDAGTVGDLPIFRIVDEMVRSWGRDTTISVLGPLLQLTADGCAATSARLAEGRRDDRPLDVGRPDRTEMEKKAPLVLIQDRIDTRVAETTDELITIAIRVHPSVARDFERTVSAYARLQKATLEAGNRPIQLELLRTEARSGADEVTKSAVVLSRAEEDEFRDQGFLSCLPLRITGRLRKRRTVVVLGGADVELGSAELKVLLVLVAGHRASASGWVRRESLRSGAGLGFETLGDRFCPTGTDQALYRLRRALASALQGLSATDFIECSGGRVRLSTHRCYLRWDRPDLLRHFDPDVRAIAVGLPPSFDRTLRNPLSQ